MSFSNHSLFAAFVTLKQQNTQALDNEIETLNRVNKAPLTVSNKWKTASADGTEIVKLHISKTSIPYLSLFVCSAPVCKVNIAPDVNSRVASVKDYFENRRGDTSIYQNAIESDGTSFGSRPLAIFPYTINDQSVDTLSLKSTAYTSISSKKFNSNSSRITVGHRTMYPNLASQKAFDRTLYVLNLHNKFKDAFPPYTDEAYMEVLFSCDNLLKDEAGLVNFVMEHQLPPSLISVFGTHNGKFPIWLRT